MRTKRRWLALVAAGLGLGLTGCQTWVGGMTLPSPRYLEHYPQYFPPCPAFPLPREQASMEDPEGLARRAGIPGVGPAVVAPAVPIPVGPGLPGVGPGLPPPGPGLPPDR
jgi:hypothetical protein